MPKRGNRFIRRAQHGIILFPVSSRSGSNPKRVMLGEIHREAFQSGMMILLSPLLIVFR